MNSSKEFEVVIRFKFQERVMNQTYLKESVPNYGGVILRALNSTDIRDLTYFHIEDVSSENG